MQQYREACLTGIRSTQLRNRYRQYLTKLNFHPCDTIHHETELLIVGSILTQKYKMYKLLKNRITCVSYQWLVQSQNVGRQLEYNQFSIKLLLENATIGIYGFDEQIVKKIGNIVKEKGGKLIQINHAHLFGDIRCIDDCQIIEVLIIPKKIVNTIGIVKDGEVRAPVFPCVGIQWLEACIGSGQCRYPGDYAYNYLYIKPKRRQKQINNLLVYKQKLMNKKLIKQNPLQQSKSQYKAKIKQIKPTLITQNIQLLEKYKQQQKIAKKNNDNLENYYFYFHPLIQNYQMLVVQLLKSIICMKNGMYFNTISPLVTHIIVDEICQNQYLELMKFGNHIPILRVQWLIDTILYCGENHQKMDENDYIVRSFKDTQHLEKISPFQPLLHQSNDPNSRLFTNSHIKQSSLKFLHMNYQSRSTNTNQLSNTNLSLSRIYARNNSISRPLILKQIAVIKKKAIFKSNIFKNVIFYIPNKYRKEKEFKNIVTSIRENGGIAYDKPKINKIMYCILLDGIQVENMYQQLSKGYENNLRPVSYRWIRYCIKKEIYIQFNEQNYFIFKPFKFQIPIFGFLVCINDSLKIRIRELLDQLGSKKIKPTISEMTHCLCGDGGFRKDRKKFKGILDSDSSQPFNQKQQSTQQRIYQIKKENPKVKFIKLQWIFDCLNIGQMLPLQDYKIETLQQDSS